MGKEKDLQVDDLETVATEQAAEVKTKKEKTPPTPEEIAALIAASEKVKQFGVTPEFAKVMELVPQWHDTEANKDKKAEVSAFFGGSDKLKDYIDGPFQAELAVINGLSKVASTMNNIKSFYARREGTSKPKVKTSQVNIGGKFYLVNAEYLASLTGVESAEKIELLLAHADTKENDAIEIL
jgi:hypothetical protein